MVSHCTGLVVLALLRTVSIFIDLLLWSESIPEYHTSTDSTVQYMVVFFLIKLFYSKKIHIFKSTKNGGIDQPTDDT